MNPSSVLIVGAGPTGMTAAIELARAGIHVRIIDKADHPALHSQALVVQARTLEQFQRYGIASKAVAKGRKLTNVKIWSDGKTIASIPFDRIPSRYPFLLFLPQNETEAILNELMESLGVRTERKTELVSFTQADGGISAILRHPDGKQENVNPRWIVGCDGAHSIVRELAAIPFEGGGVGLSFFLGDLELEGPGAPTDGLLLHFHAGDVVFMGHLSDRITRVIVAVHEQQEEDTQRKLTIKDFEDTIDKAGIQVKVRSSEWMTPFHVNDRQAKHYRAGNVFLAGDASHIHSPVGGQGMNTGIQDIANLSWKLAAVARGANDRLLDSYEQERAEVGKALLRFTEGGLKLGTASNPLVEAVRNALLPIVSSLKPVQNATLGFISETAIDYRSSSIVSDEGGDGSLKAGDRMPDIALRGHKTSTLLEDWTDARHLALMLDATDEEIAGVSTRLTHARIVSLRASDLDEEGRHLLGSGTKLLILRPDGYLGFRGPITKRAEWEAYAVREGLLAAHSAAVAAT
jgi:2-polyprenyl-6-methoxyphenol hydroxylase-like FAD-dependent oxidoreductase